jgi:hypothetical protein
VEKIAGVFVPKPAGSSRETFEFFGFLDGRRELASAMNDAQHFNPV